MKKTGPLLALVSIAVLGACSQPANEAGEAERSGAVVGEAQASADGSNLSADEGSNGQASASIGQGTGAAAQSADAGNDKVAAAVTPMEQPAAFAVCKACHAVEPGKQGVGPSMAGIFGRKAGSVEGYNYSPALAAADITWDRASLDSWLEAPTQMVPGTKMILRVPDAEKREAIIDYLESIK